MDINVKVNVDADKAIEKLERIRDLYKEINDLKQEDINTSIGYLHNSNGWTPRKSQTCGLVHRKDGLYVKYASGEVQKLQSFQKNDSQKNRSNQVQAAKDFMS
ncbi:hypothetical protein NIT62_08900 [Mammaliicoccus sciuri]|nr:hypothetical protein NIT62_08900 [Mammaliicoccus sciuri]